MTSCRLLESTPCSQLIVIAPRLQSEGCICLCGFKAGQTQHLLCKATTQAHKLQGEGVSLTSPRWLHEKLIFVRVVF